MYGDLLLDRLGVNFLGPAPLDLELLHTLTTFHWNALGSALGWWFCHNKTVSCNEKFWVEQVTVAYPHPGEGQGVGKGGGYEGRLKHDASPCIDRRRCPYGLSKDVSELRTAVRSVRRLARMYDSQSHNYSAGEHCQHHLLLGAGVTKCVSTQRYVCMQVDIGTTTGNAGFNQLMFYVPFISTKRRKRGHGTTSAPGLRGHLPKPDTPPPAHAAQHTRKRSGLPAIRASLKTPTAAAERIVQSAPAPCPQWAGTVLVREAGGGGRPGPSQLCFWGWAKFAPYEARGAP